MIWLDGLIFNEISILVLISLIMILHSSLGGNLDKRGNYIIHAIIEKTEVYISYFVLSPEAAAGLQNNSSLWFSCKKQELCDSEEI